DVDREQALVHRFVTFQQRRQVEHRGVVEEHLRHAEALLGGVDHGVNLWRLGDVGGQVLEPPGMGGQDSRHCLRCRGRDVDHGTKRALRQVSLRDGEPDPTPCTGEQGMSVLQAAVHAYSFSKCAICSAAPRSAPTRRGFPAWGPQSTALSAKAATGSAAAQIEWATAGSMAWSSYA